MKNIEGLRLKDAGLRNGTFTEVVIGSKKLTSLVGFKLTLGREENIGVIKLLDSDIGECAFLEGLYKNNITFKMKYINKDPYATARMMNLKECYIKSLDIVNDEVAKVGYLEYVFSFKIEE